MRLVVLVPISMGRFLLVVSWFNNFAVSFDEALVEVGKSLGMTVAAASSSVLVILLCLGF